MNVARSVVLNWYTLKAASTARSVVGGDAGERRCTV